jgi:hypothetical protein
MDVTNMAKSFWEKPEGKTGKFFAAAGILGGMWFLWKFGAAMITAAQNGFILAGYTVAAIAIGYVLWDPRFRAMVGYAYKGLMRFLTGLVIQIDPIGILKSYVDDLKESLSKMDKQIGLLRGSIRTLKNKIAENERIASNSMAIASQAKKQGITAQAVLKTRKAGRLIDSNKTYSDLLIKLEVIYRVLAKMFENCGILIEDTEDQVQQKEIEWKTIRQAHSAMRSAMSIINGDKDKKAIYEQALDVMATDLGNKLGEMERFMEVSQNFMEGVDLENGAFDEKGLALLEKWEKDADSWLLGPNEKKQIIADANNDSNILNLDVSVTAPSKESRTNSYSNLFNQ